METPFHLSRKRDHQMMSLLKPVFSLIGASKWICLLEVSIIRLRKVRPGFTTVLACCKYPIKERSWYFVHDFLSFHDWIKRLRRYSFWRGKQSCICSMSIRIPRNSMIIAGPTTFSCFTGKPSSWQKGNAKSKDFLHDSTWGHPATRKLSK